MSLDTDGHAVSRRKALKVAAAALCSEVGFGMAEDAALETLTEMLQACRFLIFFSISNTNYSLYCGYPSSLGSIPQLVMHIKEKKYFFAVNQTLFSK